MRQAGITLKTESISLLNVGRILVIKFRSLLWHFHPMSATSPEKAISHRASSRFSFAIDTEFIITNLIQDSMTTQYAVCHLERGAGNDSG
ncbi:hypothetical protein, partial [uncultured Muribaculum sp.]|uniref:hypothetical protein n=1 Tax=uncultured Muribaculum sp. TaxID=1918613 RepID=UPI00260B6BAD